MKSDLWFFVNKQNMSEVLQPDFYTPRSQFGLYCEWEDIAFPFRVTMTAYKNSKLVFEETVFIDKKEQKSEEYNLICKDSAFILEYWADEVCFLPDKLYVKVKTQDTEYEKWSDCEYAVISGKITDFGGYPFPASVQLFRYGFGYPHRIGVWSDSDGNYSVTVPKGFYNAIYVDDDSYRKTTLENWCWNMIIDRDETLDFKVGTGEVYSLAPWLSNGGMPVMLLYFRPMMLRTEKEYTKEINGREYAVIDIAPGLKPEDIKVMANGKELKIISLQTIYETHNDTAMPACVIQTEKPDYTADKITVTVEYNTVCGDYTATSQGRCQFYIRDGFVNTIL